MPDAIVAIQATNETWGQDTRKLSKQELEELGHTQKPILSILREKCLDCCCNQPGEVRRCTAVQCSLWPYRMGTNPLRKKSGISEEQRAARVDRLHNGRDANFRPEIQAKNQRKAASG